MTLAIVRESHFVFGPADDPSCNRYFCKRATGDGTGALSVLSLLLIERHYEEAPLAQPPKALNSESVRRLTRPIPGPDPPAHRSKERSGTVSSIQLIEKYDGEDRARNLSNLGRWALSIENMSEVLTLCRRWPRPALGGECAAYVTRFFATVSAPLEK